MMETRFRASEFVAGLTVYIQAISKHLIHHFVGADPQGNELRDRPVVLRC